MTKYAAYGTEITIAGSSVAQVTGISGPGISADTIDVTAHDSASAYEEFVAGLLRSGEITVDIVYDPALAGHVAIWTALVARAAVAITLIFPDHPTHTTWTFQGFITGFEPAAPVDGALTASVKIKPTGALTLA